MNNSPLTLVSFKLCPYVQRAAIALLEKGVPFERRNIDLSNKPDWFLKLSPLAKVPLLLVGDEVLFESSVIAEYVDATTGGGLLASDPLEKAGQRSWIEYASSLIATIGQLYNAPDQSAFGAAYDALIAKWQTLEASLADGPWFAGDHFSLVDAAFAPAFRYFDVFEQLSDIDFFPNLDKLSGWRANLAARTSVQQAVSADYQDLLLQFLANRDSVIGRLASQSWYARQSKVA